MSIFVLDYYSTHIITKKLICKYFLFIFVLKLNIIILKGRGELMKVKEFGIYLRRLREKKSLSTHKLAELSGVSQSYISHVESGRKKNVPSTEILKKLAKPLGISPLELIEKAGHLPINLTSNEKERFSVNLDLQIQLEEMLEGAIKEIAIGDVFIPEVLDDIQNIEKEFEEHFEEYVKLSPSLLREITANADWKQEWVFDLITQIAIVSRKFVSNGKAVTELTTFLKLPGITYKDKLLSESERKQILNMVNVLFQDM